ncbi:DUF3710 domain-containing protein [Cutibacterium sp.]|uniref:DUF3710 domain-containing protein n=1 Tax=Cutibacterium sp. TaxID=1912221 RepID=UPI0026DC6C34|nr:DUF3710 domain-containing protein [Cutibacterium sp.]MDO4411870.1 DUF3710 domain-containing protein [Cutibacterium sp.]
MFGRKKRKAVETDEAIDEKLETTQIVPDAPEAEETTKQEEPSEEKDASAYQINLDREDGPFDIEEVDLDADDVDRLDFGSLIVTPFKNMQMQIQLDQTSGAVQSLLVVQGNSAIEVALFAAPASTLMIDEVHEEMVRGTAAQGGEANVGNGPMGAELRRIVPMKGPNGEDGYHVSRTWLAQGPRWLLRGVLMGESAIGEKLDATGQLLLEFFCNLVVRRDNSPRVPGDVIPLKVPEDLRPEES